MIGLLQEALDTGGETWTSVYLATLNTAQVVLLAWIGSEQAASGRERRRRQREEGR